MLESLSKTRQNKRSNLPLDFMIELSPNGMALKLAKLRLFLKFPNDKTKILIRFYFYFYCS